MASDTDPVKSPSGIKALPPTTVRQLRSSQVIVDPCSVVKELLDNSLDARATAIFVDIAANTYNSIQVKDNGHGIPAEDRALVCRRYCTSKIRDLRDLREVGGKWLGFRGEAMASIAEVSGAIEVMTRVEGEPVAVLLKYGHKGELHSTERASHPVGTTVKVTELFKALPVRQQEAVKHSTKFLARIRRLMQAYALARPTVRFQLRVLKAKSEKDNFIYAPKAGANIEDAAFKIVGRNCASQCDWTVIESDGYEISAFIPKPDAVPTKIANEGAFLSVDSRPVTAKHGTTKKVIEILRNALRKASPSLASVREPLFCVNIKCPPDSYDPNIEPAKDNVLFCDESAVLKAVENLARAFYPETAAKAECDLSPLPSAVSLRNIPSRSPLDTIDDTPHIETPEKTTIPDGTPHWRSNMYGIDEEDLHWLSGPQPHAIDEEEEEDLRAPEVSNPWIIAKMNAALNLKRAPATVQLMTPVKGPGDVVNDTCPAQETPAAIPPADFAIPTPKTVSKHSTVQPLINDELEASIQPLPAVGPGPTSHDHSRHRSNDNPTRFDLQFRSMQPALGNDIPFEASASSTLQRSGTQARNYFPVNAPSNAFESPSQIPPKPRQRRRSPRGASNGNWFGQFRRGRTAFKKRGEGRPGRNTLRPPRPQQRQPIPRRENSDTESCLGEGLTNENNADIRQFLGTNRDAHQPGIFHDRSMVSAFTPINQRRARERNDNTRRPLSATSVPEEVPDIAEQLRAYAERESPYMKPSSEMSSERPQSAPSRDLVHIKDLRDLGDSSPTPGPSSRPVRPRTAETLHRTKPAELHLTRVPQGYEVHNIILVLHCGVSQIRAHMRKLDMARNNPEWGYPASEDYDALDMPVTEDRLTEWTRAIASFLDGRYERRDGANVEGDIAEALTRLSKAMCEEEEMLM